VTLAEKSGMTILAARGRAILDMASPFDSLTLICFGIFRLSLIVQKLLEFFDNHEKRPLKILGKG
jgi:hypothetical protein